MYYRTIIGEENNFFLQAKQRSCFLNIIELDIKNRFSIKIITFYDIYQDIVQNNYIYLKWIRSTFIAKPLPWWNIIFFKWRVTLVMKKCQVINTHVQNSMKLISYMWYFSYQNI